MARAPKTTRRKRKNQEELQTAQNTQDVQTTLNEEGSLKDPNKLTDLTEPTDLKDQSNLTDLTEPTVEIDNESKNESLKDLTEPTISTGETTEPTVENVSQEDPTAEELKETSEKEILEEAKEEAKEDTKSAKKRNTKKRSKKDSEVEVAQSNQSNQINQESKKDRKKISFLDKVKMAARNELSETEKLKQELIKKSVSDVLTQEYQNTVYVSKADQNKIKDKHVTYNMSDLGF